jgi:two-component system chemotaxis sensor kinase CheA
MAKALHAGEDLLGAMRDGEARATRDTIGVLLQLVARLQRWIGSLDETAALPSDAAGHALELADSLREHLPARKAETTRRAAPVDVDWAHAWLSDILPTLREPPQFPLVAIRYEPLPECFFAGEDPLATMRSVPRLMALRVLPREPWPAVAELDPFSCNLRIEAIARATPEEIGPIFRFVADQVAILALEQGIVRGGAGAQTNRSSGAGTTKRPAGAGPLTLRVDARRVDRLVDLVDELVIAKNGLSFAAAQAGQSAGETSLLKGIAASQAQIERVVAELHAAVMGIRLLPLRDAFRGLPLAVRDLSVRLGKEVEFTTQGEEVEADKAVVEGLSEPLLHLVRNALDHGLEKPEVRAAAGKPPRGRIELRAKRSGDKVLVDVIDDGRGLDPEAIRKVARERGLDRDRSLDALTDDQVVDLVFAPGFSTATAVTDVSGRGVGMDAVRTAIERLGGRVSIASTPGEGASVRLVLPVSVLLTRIMVVRVGEEAFGVPIDSVVETTRLPRDRVVSIRDRKAFVFRGRTLSLLDLSILLGRDSDVQEGDLRVMLVSTGSERVGVAVAGFGERMDVMLRPMTGILAGMPGFAGTTLRGDGSVLMVLDLAELIG